MLIQALFGHASNLAVADAVTSVQCIISDSLDSVREIGKSWLKSHRKETQKHIYFLLAT